MYHDNVKIDRLRYKVQIICLIMLYKHYVDLNWIIELYWLLFEFGYCGHIEKNFDFMLESYKSRGSYWFSVIYVVERKEEHLWLCSGDENKTIYSSRKVNNKFDLPFFRPQLAVVSRIDHDRCAPLPNMYKVKTNLPISVGYLSTFRAFE